MKNLVGKTVNLELVGLDGNAFFLLASFSNQAKKEGWTREEIDKVITEAKSKDYDYLLQVLIAHTDTLDEEQ